MGAGAAHRLRRRRIDTTAYHPHLLSHTIRHPSDLHQTTVNRDTVFHIPRVETIRGPAAPGENSVVHLRVREQRVCRNQLDV